MVWAGYAFARDSELAGYEGVELRNRVAIASLLLPAVWLLYWFVPSYLFDLDQPSQMSIVWFGIMLAVMLGVGGILCTAIFELEMFNGVIHGGLYVVATLILAVIAGIGDWAAQPIEVDELSRHKPAIMEHRVAPCFDTVPELSAAATGSVRIPPANQCAS